MKLRTKVARRYLKIRILAQGQGGSGIQPAGILKYVEDLKRGANAVIGLKNFFEMPSNHSLRSRQMKSPSGLNYLKSRDSYLFRDSVVKVRINSASQHFPGSIEPLQVSHIGGERLNQNQNKRFNITKRGNYMI